MILRSGWFDCVPEIVEGSNLMTAKMLEAIRAETNGLIAIFVSLINKWRRK